MAAQVTKLMPGNYFRFVGYEADQNIKVPVAV
jgi:hypothetical protein